MFSKLLNALRPGQSTVVEMPTKEARDEVVREVTTRGWVAKFTERREMHTTLDKNGWHLRAATELEPAKAEILRTI